MSRFNVVFSTDNDAFHIDDDTALDERQTADEVARILRQLAQNIENTGRVSEMFRIRDANGARIGFATGLDMAEAAP
jgi:hypothetical protein